MEVYPVEIIDEFYLQSCVLCASIPEERNTDIFSVSGTQLKLQEYINDYLNIKIEEDDGLPHGVCVPCVKVLNAFHKLFKTSKISYRKLKLMRDAYHDAQMEEQRENVKNIITIDGLIETSTYNVLPSAASNVPSPVGSEQEILYELDTDMAMEELQSESNVETAAEMAVEKITEVAETVTEDVSNVEPEPVEMEEYSALIPLTKGSQQAYIYIETNAYVLSARLHVIAMNINEAVLADQNKLQETVARITVDVKRHIKKFHVDNPFGPEFTAKFLCLTCSCSFYCKEEMVAHFGSLHPTELRQCSLCPEQICGPDEIFNKHVEFHKAMDTNDIELMMELTSTHSLNIPEPEYVLFTVGNITPEIVSFVKDGSKLLEIFKMHAFIKPDMPRKLLYWLQKFLLKRMPDRRVKCEFCKKFIRDVLYTDHLNEVHHIPKHRCPHCHKIIEESEVEFHVKRFHKGGKLLYCKVCDTEYNTTHLDQPHMFLKPDKKVYTCSVETCKRVFSNQRKYESHLSHHRKEIPPDPVLCDLCGKMQRSKRGLKKHLILTHFSEKKNIDVEYVCDICGKLYDSKRKLKRHLEYCQGDRIPCDICGKLYTKEVLTKHKKIHRDASERFPCKHCGRLFILKFECQAHELTHEGVQLKCTVCKPIKFFRTVTAAAKHREKHERGETFKPPPPKPTVQCPLCFLVLKNQRNLNIHMQAHVRRGSSAQPKKGGLVFTNKVLEFACYVCLVRYGTQQQFDEHMEAYHPHGVPTPDPNKVLAKSFSYQCSFCPKMLKNLANFKNHEASHRRGKNYSCKYCKRNFFNVKERSQHMKNCECKN